MKRIVLFAITLTLILALAACNNSAPDAETNADQTPLIAAELDVFTVYLMDAENNGFLGSSYSDPSQIDLDYVFYNGAGFSNSGAWQHHMSDAEMAAYLAALGPDEEIWGDINKLTTEQIDTFMRQKTGLGLEDIQYMLTWTYVPEYDAWYNQVTDFFEVRITCQSGYRTADGYIVIDYAEPEDMSYRQSGTVTLRESDDGYQFVANTISEAAY